MLDAGHPRFGQQLRLRNRVSNRLHPLIPTRLGESSKSVAVRHSPTNLDEVGPRVQQLFNGSPRVTEPSDRLSDPLDGLNCPFTKHTGYVGVSFEDLSGGLDSRSDPDARLYLRSPLEHPTPFSDLGRHVGTWSLATGNGCS